MAGSGRLQADPLFQGLARPTMVFGVSYMYCVINAFLCVLMFVWSKNFYSWGMLFINHGFGYLLCMKEPRAVELWLMRMNKGYRSWNRKFHHNTNSYDVF